MRAAVQQEASVRPPKHTQRALPPLLTLLAGSRLRRQVLLQRRRPRPPLRQRQLVRVRAEQRVERLLLGGGQQGRVRRGLQQRNSRGRAGAQLAGCSMSSGPTAPARQY